MIALGLIVLLAGGALLAFEAHVPTAGIAGAAGVAGLIGGVAVALAGAGAAPAVTFVATVAVAGVLIGSLMLAMRRVAGARRALPHGGRQGLVGHVGVVRSWSGASGKVLVDGALWRAQAGPLGAEAEPGPGDAVVVDGLHGLTLSIHRAEEWEVAA